MHDILCLIFEQLPPEKDFKRLEGLLSKNPLPSLSLPSLHAFAAPNRMALARAARVCREFSAPALAVLWRDIEDLVPLFSLFSSFKAVSPEQERVPRHGPLHELLGNVESQDVWMLCGLPTEAEVERFKLYAAFVRSACLFKTDEIDPSVFTHLSHVNGGKPLLPSARKLTFEQSVAFEAALLTLVSPSLHSLSLLFGVAAYLRNRGQITRRDHMLRTALERVCTMAPSLSYVNVSGWIRPSTLVPIAQLSNLATVQLSLVHRVTDANGELLRALSISDSLVELHIPHELAVEVAHCRGGFPNLRILEVYGGLTNVASLFSQLDSPHLRELSLTASPLNSFELLPPALDHCTRLSSLESLTISTQSMLLRSFAPPTAGEEPIALTGLLAPILQLRRLRKLWFHVNKTFSLSDADLQAMGAAWPKLASFLVSYQVSGTVPTMRGVQALARACQHLTVLHLPCMDPSPPYAAEDLASSRHGLRLMCVERLSPSIGEAAAELAIAIDAFFPRLNVPDSRSFKMFFGDIGILETPWAAVLDAVVDVRLSRRSASGAEDVDKRHSCDAYGTLNAENLNMLYRSLADSIPL